MALSIGDILAKAQPAKERRTFQPCRRNSYYANDQRALSLWKPLGKSKSDARRMIAARLQAAEYYDRQNKAPGARNGPLGHVALEVLRELYRIVDFKTGRLEPAIDTICAKVKRARAAVVAALKRLKEHGFVDWVRRTEKTDNDGAGPQIRQITNAYGFGLPAAVVAWVKRKTSNGPTPACEGPPHDVRNGRLTRGRRLDRLLLAPTATLSMRRAGAAARRRERLAKTCARRTPRTLRNGRRSPRRESATNEREPL